ncbi:helix-turn-helix domain-containing protein [Streptobacillus notomytis]|uniref:helix-turn-helix domain-containing protein n=1 Tax=Streptobacillus notomytis TaxID=1712031 RepID=UPI0009F8B288
MRLKRKEFKYSFKELSELTNIPISTLSSYEKGTIKNISHENLKILANVFFTDINYFLLDDSTLSSLDKPIKEELADIIINSQKEILKTLYVLDILEKDNLDKLFIIIKNFIKENKK